MTLHLTQECHEMKTMPGFGKTKKSHFRNDLLYIGYNKSSPTTTLFSGPIKWRYKQGNSTLRYFTSTFNYWYPPILHLLPCALLFQWSRNDCALYFRNQKQTRSIERSVNFHDSQPAKVIRVTFSDSGNFSNLRIRLLFRLLLTSIQPKFIHVFTYIWPRRLMLPPKLKSERYSDSDFFESSVKRNFLTSHNVGIHRVILYIYQIRWENWWLGLGV